MRKRGSPLPRSVRIRPWTPLPPEPPVDELRKSARKLPMFGPGIVIRVALPIQPAYMELYDLVPLNRGEVRDMEQKLGHSKAADVLWVKRVPKQQTRKEI